MSGHPAGRRHRLAAVVAAFALAGAVAGCGGDNTINEQAKQGDDKGYIAGDGGVQELPADERAAPVELSGTTLAGKRWSLTDAAGQVVVLNVWGSWCKPCQAEVPHLEQAHEKWTKAKAPVQLMGLAQRDPSVDNARSALRRWGGTYPSLADDGGRALLQLQGKVVATPTTLVLDKQHRIAARVSGSVTTTTLTELVDTVLAEKS